MDGESDDKLSASEHVKSSRSRRHINALLLLLLTKVDGQMQTRCKIVNKYCGKFILKIPLSPHNIFIQ